MANDVLRHALAGWDDVITRALNSLQSFRPRRGQGSPFSGRLRRLRAQQTAVSAALATTRQSQQVAHETDILRAEYVSRLDIPGDVDSTQEFVEVCRTCETSWSLITRQPRKGKTERPTPATDTQRPQKRLPLRKGQLTTADARSTYGLASSTLHDWIAKNLIKSDKDPNLGMIVIDENSLKKHLRAKGLLQ